MSATPRTQLARACWRTAACLTRLDEDRSWWQDAELKTLLDILEWSVIEVREEMAKDPRRRPWLTEQTPPLPPPRPAIDSQPRA